MRILIAAFIALFGAVVLSLWVKQDNGYVLIGYGQWTVEGSLALFVLAAVALFVVLYMIIRSAIHVWSMPLRIAGWRQRRRVLKAQQALTRGLVELAEGRWKVAERHLTRFATQSETPLLNYLAAARAAQLQGEHERRDDYLHLAHESMPSADVAVGLTQAELQLAHQQYEQALATLMHVRSLSPKHSYVMTLLKKLYENLGEWQKLEEMLPELKRRRVINEQEFQSLERRVYGERLKQESSQLSTLVSYWQIIPKAVRQQQSMLLDYSRYMMALDAGSRVEPLIVNSIQREWSGELVDLYGQIELADPSQQLATAEGWLKQHPEDPILLLTLARLSLQNKLWGKGRSYLEASIGIAPTAESYQQLGVLLERLGETDKAMQCFRSGLGLAHQESQRSLPPISARPALSQSSEPIQPPSLVENV
ncbi:MAG: heme biosynthesis protein HemY [Candidatus Thiodiazotropha taylori]|nr:heme biosynthesis protein HemY [Candidatus Thiodiazotropha taylori]RLW70710.1 MAG: heme biosynthesis protein HemY [gamma proteobacterium symbiont of Stewartia floridana]MCG7925314.1 heme biosynthesis protein HemY [Candidatus Thiodiazotropha taylori]MCG7935144.1 heme biosynthesis protein HemY [Candidatus Thiodiazotropha taylori]MCG7942327.1 heme biosynthesis protein HemY [Candidatus Thiodiazotropha taylori]